MFVISKRASFLGRVWGFKSIYARMLVIDGVFCLRRPEIFTVYLRMPRQPTSKCREISSV